MDATLKELNLWKSIKKFWIDGLSVPVYFDQIFVTDRVEDRWIGIAVANLRPAHVHEASMRVYIFSKEDVEGNKLVGLRDDVLELLEPGRINLYDVSLDPWEKIGGILVSVDSQTVPSGVPGGGRIKTIQTTLKWGAVWS